MATYDLKVGLTDGSTIDAGSFSVENGKDGVGISSISINYGYSANVTAEPTTWSDECGSPSEHAGEILWVRMKIMLTDDSTQTAYFYLVNGKDGAAGTGKDGVGVTDVTLSEV